MPVIVCLALFAFFLGNHKRSRLVVLPASELCPFYLEIVQTKVLSAGAKLNFLLLNFFYASSYVLDELKAAVSACAGVCMCILVLVYKVSCQPKFCTVLVQDKVSCEPNFC